MTEGYLVVIKDVTGDRTKWSCYSEPEKTDEGDYIIDTFDGEQILINSGNIIYISSTPLNNYNDIYDIEKVKEEKHEYNSI